MIKKLFMVLALFSLSFVLVACNGDDNGERVEDTPDEDLREFTLDELSQYDGEDGNDAYIAVDGYVYDVTDSSLWNDGEHQGRVTAGADLTQEMDDNTRHGREMLDRVPRIGRLLDDADDQSDTSDEDDSDENDTNGGSGY